MAEQKHRPRKRFGQNFLHDQQVLGRMLQAINPAAGEHIVEIGPGEGALTCPLLQQHGSLTAIELDRDLVPLLVKKCATLGKLDIMQADALKFDFASLAAPGKPIRIVGNLPYNISTPLLFHLASYAGIMTDLHVLLQKEVAQRIAATPGNKSYGKLSVMMQSTFSAHLLFDVGPGAFKPPPKVASTFIRLKPHPAPVVDIHDHKNFVKLVTAAFSQRRKTLRNSLATVMDSSVIEAAGVDPGRRAETLSLQEFATLSNMLESSANHS